VLPVPALAPVAIVMTKFHAPPASALHAIGTPWPAFVIGPPGDVQVIVPDRAVPEAKRKSPKPRW